MRKSSHHTYVRKPSKKHGYVKRQCNAFIGTCNRFIEGVIGGLAIVAIALLIMAIGEYAKPFDTVINPAASKTYAQIVASLNGGAK